MIPRRAAAFAILAAITTLTLATTTVARPTSTPSTLDPGAFQPVVIPGGVAAVPEPLPSIDYGSPASPVPIGDFHEEARSFEPRPEPDQPVRAESVLKPTPKPKPQPNAQAAAGTSHSVRGSATWYCKPGVSVCHHAYPGGLYAAAGPALRVGDWRGRSVRVCGSGSCVTVKLIDWCACGSGRVIDLYSDAFRRLAPLSQGTLSVRVTW